MSARPVNRDRAHQLHAQLVRSGGAARTIGDVRCGAFAVTRDPHQLRGVTTHAALAAVSAFGWQAEAGGQEPALRMVAARLLSWDYPAAQSGQKFSAVTSAPGRRCARRVGAPPAVVAPRETATYPTRDRALEARRRARTWSETPALGLTEDGVAHDSSERRLGPGRAIDPIRVLEKAVGEVVGRSRRRGVCGYTEPTPSFDEDAAPRQARDFVECEGPAGARPFAIRAVRQTGSRCPTRHGVERSADVAA
jgi:hypothetical protein